MANDPIKEIRYQVGEAWKGEYNSNYPYGVAAVVQDPTGLSVYRSLKDGNTGHPLTDSNWWFKIIDMSSIKVASDNIDALNTRIELDESARVLAEQGRVDAESDRVSAESGRVTAESGRGSAEDSRVSAESGRATAETNRGTAESGRVSAESGRVTAEAGRVNAESLRNTAEGERATAENNRQAAEAERHTQYTTDHGNATSDHSTYVSDHATAAADHTTASNDHTASTEATAKANNVNATIDGMIVTITDKNGVSTSVDIGFDIYKTYASVAAMNADAANVAEGKFVMIATTDTTSVENARLYVRNENAASSETPFTFLCDLDQAASSAWADWFNNYKPTIESDHTRAENDHTQASTDHDTAASDHTQAGTDHTTADSDHTLAASDHTTASSDHTTASSDHTTAGTDHTTAAADHTQAESDHTRAETDHAGIADKVSQAELQTALEPYARQDGYYSQMAVGSAENLIGQTIDSEAYLIRPTGGESNEVANGVASVLGMEGNSCEWNQLVQNGNFVDSSNINAVNSTISVQNGVLTITASGSSAGATMSIPATISGHKYFIKCYAWGDTADQYGRTCGIGFSDSSVSVDSGHVINPTNTDNTSRGILSAIITYSGSGYNYLALRCFSSTNVSFEKIKIFDLTLLGIDNLTTTAQVEAWLAGHVGIKSYYAYNAGTILSAQTLGIKTYGQNLLNPTTRQAKLIPYEWEENSNVYTIKNVPSGATAIFTPDATGVAESVDISGGSLDITSYGSGVLELSAATADTYVCMKWDGTKDNDVVPYEEHTQTFDVRKVYGKVNGAGEYVQCYPNGLKGIGGIKDTLNANEAVSKIGSRAYQSGDKSDSTVITDETNTLYALSTPITYTDLIYRDGGIDRPLSDVLLNINVNNWSIEEQMLTPYEDGNPTAVPAKISTQYGMDAVEEIDTIKHTYVSAYTEQNFSDNQKAQARRNIGAVEEDGSYPNMSVGIAKNLAGENSVEAEYNYRKSGGTIGTDTGIANITNVKGKTMKWQQLVQNGNFTNGTSGWGSVNATISAEDNILSAVVVGNNTQRQLYLTTNPNIVVGHKYLTSLKIKSPKTCNIRLIGGSGWQFVPTTSVNANVWNNVARFTLVSGNIIEFSLYFDYNQNLSSGDTVQIKDIQIFDITEMFGAGNEPSTVAEFKALYPLAYYNYNAGTLINNNASAIETTGFNQWDEEWEIGMINETTGKNTASTSYIRSKNYISVLGGQTYYFKGRYSSDNAIEVFQYDGNKSFLRYIVNGNNTFTLDSNVKYIRFFAYSSPASYNNNICINLSDPAKNGTYEPYEKHTFYFDKVLTSSGSLATVTGKLLDGQGQPTGESVVVFPDGMKSAGNVHDEINGNVAIKRIGSRAYTSGDESDATVITDGTNTYYALTTPETYILDRTVTGVYQVNAFGTERRLPEDTASAVNAPVRYSVVYPIDAVGTITKLPINYISEGSLTNFTTELASKLGTFLNATIGINATYNQTNQEYDYTITITQN